MKILVTGGAGFIGSNLVDKLLSEGNTVFCIDNFDDFYNPEIKRKNISSALANKSFKLLEGDIRDKGFLNNCFNTNEYDIVVHLAARAGVRPSIKDPEIYYENNVMGTLNLLECMKNRHVKKLIFASSSSVYGNNKKIPFSEDDNVDFPISPYAATKKAGELLCHTYHYLYKMDIFCLRFFTVYGPRQRPEMAIHYFVDAIVNDNPIKMFGDGSSRRDYTYIVDILDGITNAIKNVNGFEIINLGESQTISLSSLIETIERVTAKKALIEKLSSQQGDVEVTYANIDKAKKLLNYKPYYPVKEGIKEFYNWFKKRVNEE